MNTSVFFGISCAVVLTACTLPALNPAEALLQQPAAANSRQMSEPADLKRIWTLESWPGFSAGTLKNSQAEINLTALPHVSAHMGCNRMMFSAETTPPQAAQGEIFIGPVAATRMLCQGNMDLEMSFATHIGSFTHYRIDGRKLVLENKEGKKAVFTLRD